MSNYEDELNRDGMQVTQFIMQEKVNERGLSTCYPTSIINAGIATGAIKTKDAMRLHRTVIDNLRLFPDLWNGSVMRIQTLDSRIAEVIENYFPIRIGFDDLPTRKRLLTVPRTYQQLRADVEDERQMHVGTVNQVAHAYAFVKGATGQMAYVDPMDPFTKNYVTEQWFQKIFYPDRNGWVSTTPVRPKVKVIRSRTILP